MDPLLISVIVFAALLAVVIIILVLQAQKKSRESREAAEQAAQSIDKLSALNEELLNEREAMTKRYKPIIDVEIEKQRVLVDLELNKSKLLSDIQEIGANHQQSMRATHERHDLASNELLQLETNISALRQELSILDENANLLSFGFYKSRYGFESSGRYQIELERVRGLQKNMISNKTAAVCTTQWTVNGSATEGRKQINQTLKLVLRAFNGECDAAIAKVKYNNAKVMEARILKAYESLNKMVSIQQIHIADQFLNAKLEELYLVHEYQEQIQEEKEEQRRIREEMREEEIARREIDKALADAEREESRYAEALRKAHEEAEKAVGEKHTKLLAQIQLLQEKLQEAQTNKQRAVSRAQMTRSGHVYVISNIGSFGEDIYKIGMTRRLDPMDRVRELGDASVPFRFDVHAIIYSEDAPTLENQLHKIFHERRVNQVNYKREFFRVTLDEITKAVHDHHGEIEFTLLAEAYEYRKTMAFLNDKGNPEQVTILENSLLEI